MTHFVTKKLFPFLLAAFAASTTAVAQDNPPWNVSMPPSAQDSGYVTVENKCTADEEFNIYSEKPTVSWVQFIGLPNPKPPVEGPPKPPITFTLASGEKANYTIGFNTNGLQPGDYQTTITMTCPDCGPPSCKYVGKKVSFGIFLTVTKPPDESGHGAGGSSGPNGGSKQPNGDGPTSTAANNSPTITGNPTDPTTVSTTTKNGNPTDSTTDKTTGTSPGTPTPPTTVSPGTPGGSTPGTNPPVSVTTDPVPPTQSTNPGDWGATIGGLLIATGLGLVTGSGRGGLRTQSRNQNPPPPPTTARTTDNPPTPTQSTPTQDGTPGTSTKPATGDWDVNGQSTPPSTTGGQSAIPSTTDKVPTGTPATTTKSNGGDWTAMGHGPISDQTGTPVTPATSEKPQGGVSNTKEKSSPGDWNVTGQSPAPGTCEKPQNAGDNRTNGVPPTQEAPGQKQPGDWDAILKMPEPQHQPGDRNEGGGRTFTREGTPGGLGDANRPPTSDELAAVQKGISSGNDDYATREKKIRQRMADRQLNKESANTIVAGGKTFVKVPWDGTYDPTGESEWIKGVRQDLMRDDVQSDATRLKIREWQLEIYQDAYTRARKAGFDNLTAHAAAQSALNDWLSQSREQFEQMMGTHLAMLGQAIAPDPIGKVNQAIAELGELGEQAAADMARTRELARTLERQGADALPPKLWGTAVGTPGAQDNPCRKTVSGAPNPVPSASCRWKRTEPAEWR